MDSLVPALVAALLAGIGDRPAALAALLAARGGGSGAIWSGALLAQCAVATLAAIAAALLAPRLTPEARSLVLAIALVAGGMGGLVRARPPRASDRLGSGFLAALVGTGALGLVDRTAFLTFALALRGPSPALAAVGGTAGAAVLAGGAVVLGADWQRLASREIAGVAGGLLMAAGLVVGVGALRLI